MRCPLVFGIGWSAPEPSRDQAGPLTASGSAGSRATPDRPAPGAATLDPLDDTSAAVGAADARPAPSGPPSNLASQRHRRRPGFVVVLSNAGNIFFATFVNDHPLALIAHERRTATWRWLGSAHALVLLRGRVRSPVRPDLFFFWIGRWYGDAAIRWMERKAPTYGSLLRQLEQWFDKARYVVVAIAPNNPVCLFAGAAGMRWGAFLAANVVGTIGRLVLIRALQQRVRGPARHHHAPSSATTGWPITALSIVLVAFTVSSDRRGGRDGIGDLVNLEEGIAGGRGRARRGGQWTPPTPRRRVTAAPVTAPPRAPLAAAHAVAAQPGLRHHRRGRSCWAGSATCSGPRWSTGSPLTLLLLNAKPRYQLLTINELDPVGLATRSPSLRLVMHQAARLAGRRLVRRPRGRLGRPPLHGPPARSAGPSATSRRSAGC